MDITRSSANMSAVNVADDPCQSGFDEMHSFEPELNGEKFCTEPYSVRSTRRAILLAFLVIFLVAFALITERIQLPF